MLSVSLWNFILKSRFTRCHVDPLAIIHQSQHLIWAKCHKETLSKWLSSTDMKSVIFNNDKLSIKGSQLGTFCPLNSNFAILTLKWPRHFYSRWCPRGFHGTPLKKTTFPPEFCNEICTIYVWTIKNHNSAKKINK